MESQNKNEEKRKTEIIYTNGKGFDGLKGKLFQNRYLIGDFVDEGGQGKIFSVVDTKRDQAGKIPLIIKISEEYTSITEEISVLKKIRKE